MKIIKLLIVLFVVMLIGWGIYYFLVGRFYESTDDAYTTLHTTNISAQVSSHAAISYLHDNERVNKGQLLVKLDDRPFVSTLQQRKADLDSARADLEYAQANYDVQLKTIAEYQADVVSAKATLSNSQQEFHRYQTLVNKGVSSRESFDQQQMTYSVDQANYLKAKAQLTTEKEQLKTLSAKIDQSKSSVISAQAALGQAQLNVTYTEIRAPMSGYINNRSVEPGDMVQAGDTLASIVSNDRPWIVANFKETQVGHIHPGQAVDISIDAYPNKTFKGHVDSLASATGSTFALLPADNATGNFTKIVQRVPVKIVFDKAVTIPAGLSSEVSVHVQ